MKEETVELVSLDKPREDTEFAKASAVLLMDIVKKNGWAKRLGGSQDHLQYEAWQTVGKFYGYTVKTGQAEYIEMGDSQGFKAIANVVNETTGIQVGGAEAFCMNDEPNWKNKPKFQLASMAQTRAGSKALRQILGFVVALAGYSPTPAEEMIEPTAGEKSGEKSGEKEATPPRGYPQGVLSSSEKRGCIVHPTSFWGRKSDGTYFDHCSKGFKLKEECRTE